MNSDKHSLGLNSRTERAAERLRATYNTTTV